MILVTITTEGGGRGYTKEQVSMDSNRGTSLGQCRAVWGRVLLQYLVYNTSQTRQTGCFTLNKLETLPTCIRGVELTHLVTL